MKVPYAWLREYCDPGASVEELAERLAMTGTEVERVGTIGPPSAEAFVVGRVLAVEKHPKADRLSVCTVDTGDGERTIVCGAPNVAAGQTVPVALPGATLPGGHEIGEAKLRGVRSAGMICASSELELGEGPPGIMVLDDDGLAPGTSLAEVLPIAEQVLELEVTPNRVDCFGVYGVAREVHAISGASLDSEPWAEDAPAGGKGEVGDYASVEVEAPDLCPRFTARVFTDVTIAPSPPWLQARLTAAGQRPINNVVDITNYVMLLTAQPLHAFDLDKVPGGALTVRTAAEGEKMTTLDGEERAFDAETVLVCDSNGPSGIAGIMGGQTSEVSDETTSVLLEVANWAGTNILRTSRMLGLRSEASSRFEKQLHPGLCARAQRVASRLMVELCDAELVPGTIDVAAEIPSPHRIVLRGERVEGLLGMRIEQADQVAYLERLGFDVEADGEDLEVEVPPDRHYDVTREVDLIEEVARVHGLDEHLPSTLPASAGQVGGLNREQRLRRRAEDSMRDLGFDEIVGWSFTDPGEPGRLRISGGDPRAKGVVISNPLSEDQSVMRTTLLGSLLNVAQRNRARGVDRISLFESGRVYLPTGRKDDSLSPTGLKDQPEWTDRPVGALAGDFPGHRPPPFAEPHRLGCLAIGSLAPTSWRGEAETTDFFALKGVLEALVGQLGAELSLDIEPSGDPFLHPGRSARFALGGAPAGWIGELHPLICREWDIAAAVAFELELEALVASSRAGGRPSRTSPPSPASTRTWLSSSTKRSRRPQCARPCSRAAASCCGRPRSSTSTRASSWVRAARAWRCGLSSAPLTAPSPTRRSPACATRSPPSWRRSGGSSVNKNIAQPLNGKPAARMLVAGASGFTGALAAHLVWRHPHLELVTVTSRSDAGTRLDRLYPRYRVPLELTELDLDRIEDVDAAIVAYPHGASAPTVAALRGLGVIVADLSADFRLRDLPTYERWYGEHGAPELLEGAVYGLTELYREQLREAALVAVPGCYPTASVLALAPLAERGLLADVVIDAKQGVSGAGRGGGDAMHYVTIDENAFPYKTEGHRHRPEIEQELAALGGAAPVTFVPHLLPLDQGELTSCYVQTVEPISKQEVQDLYRERYAEERFVHFVEAPPGLRDVRDTNECHVYVTVEERGRVLAFSAIDNLWKGASGQAVQCLNLMLGLDETEGLT